MRPKEKTDSLRVASIALAIDEVVDDPKSRVLGEIEKILSETDADAILLPEYLWAAVAVRFADEGEDFKRTSTFLWRELIPDLVRKLPQDKLYVLGTGPFWDAKQNKLFNRSPIFIDGELRFQDKCYLTPWESRFSPGNVIHVFEFRGIRFAVIICLDIEIPSISLLLKKWGVSLTFVPSATETPYGFERIQRCASCRAVELGSGVIVSHLRGELEAVDLVSENVGGTAFYLPAQKVFPGQRERVSPCGSHGHVWDYLDIPMNLLALSKNADETNPSRLEDRSGLSINF